METPGHFSDFLSKIGTHNFLAIGIVVIIIWHLISGLKKGLKKKGRDEEPEKDDNDKDEDLSD